MEKELTDYIAHYTGTPYRAAQTIARRIVDTIENGDTFTADDMLAPYGLDTADVLTAA